jgi:hypothetical protein
MPDMFLQWPPSPYHSTDQLLLAQTGPQHHEVPVADTLANLPPGTSLATILNVAGVPVEAIKAATFCTDITTNKDDSLH